MPQPEVITLAHWKGKKKKKNRVAGQISRQATGKRPGAPNGQSAPDKMKPHTTRKTISGRTIQSSDFMN